MERLTIKKCGELLIKNNDDEYRSPCFGCENISKCNPEKMPCGFYKALEKLKEYEDLEEQGRLTKLPCNIGDWLWVVRHYGFIEYHSVVSIEIEESGIYFKSSKLFGTLEDFGKTIFFSREEAEEALKRMEDGNEAN